MEAWSPKRQLASRLTGILQSYCKGIDVEGVQANLLNDDTRIVLEHVCLGMDGGIVGAVDAITFAWKWGDDNGLMPFGIRECTLEMRGVDIETGLALLQGTEEPEHDPSQQKDEADMPAAAPEAPPENTPPKPAPAFWERYVDEYVQSLMDSMTVELLDVKILVEQELEVAFDRLVLESFGKQGKTLSQRVSLEGLTVGCRSSDTKVLEPFSYSATVKRVDGKRFGSFQNGFDIVGDEPGNNIAKINIESLRALIPFIGKFLERHQETSGGNVCSERTEAPQLLEGATTRIVLPLPDIVVVLPTKNTPVTFHGATLCFHLDGSVVQMSGRKGLSCNGWPALRIAEGAAWCLDLARQSFTIQRDGFVDANASEDATEDPILQLEWCSGQWGLPLLEECLGLQEMVEHLLSMASPASSSPPAAIPSIASDPWHVSIGGTVLARVKDENENWVQLAMDQPSVTLAQVSLAASTEEMRLTSSSGIRIVFPRVRLGDLPDGIAMDGVVTCRLQALSNLEATSHLLDTQAKGALALFGCHKTDDPIGLEAKYESEAILPTSLRIPQVRLSVQQQGIHISLDDIVATATLDEIRFSHVHFADSTGTILSASDFIFGLQDGSATLLAIESLYIPGVASITDPVRSVELKGCFDRDIKVYVPAVSFMLLDSTNNKHSEQTKASPKVPFPIGVYVSEISVESKSRRLAIIHGTHIDLKAAGGCRFDAGFRKLESLMVHLHDSSCSGVLGVETIYGMRVRPGLVKIGTDISTFDWSLLVSDGRTDRPSSSSTVWNLPDVVMDSFSIQISLQKDSLSTGKPHRIAAYKGGPMTTSADLNDYGYKLLMNEFPHLYTKTMVCGVRATDLTAKAAGRLAGSTVIGSAFGSVGALIATDSLRSVLTLGRKERADADENKLRSKDFVVGLWRATKATAKLGGELRRGDIEYRYQPGDVLFGASKAFSSYVHSNSSRFGSAAFSAIGVACGGALYGFGGMLVGNLVGGQAGAMLFERKAGQSTVEITSGEINVEPLDDDDSSWLVVSFAHEPENCRTSEGMADSDVPANPCGTEDDPSEDTVPIPSAPIASMGTEEDIAIEGPHLEPAQQANAVRSYSEKVKHKARGILGFGPSNRTTWTKA